MTEENDSLRALGLDSVSARWRFVVDGALIVEEENLRGNVAFDGDTAPHLIELAKQWRAAG
jgi:hypothetical protein